MATSGDIFVTSVRALYGLVIFFAVILMAITIHSFAPVTDPVSAVTFLDRISYIMGVHEKSAIVIVDLGAIFIGIHWYEGLSFCLVFVAGAWSSMVYTYTFHRHISDGTFHVEAENKNLLLPGLFADDAASNSTILSQRIEDIISKASSHLPDNWLRFRLRPHDCHVEECRPPILVKVSNEALQLNKMRVANVLQTLHRRLETNSSFYFNPEKSFGAIASLAEETALRWFAINLLRHSFNEWKVSSSAIILDVQEKDMHITLAVPNNQALPDQRVQSIQNMEAFGHKVKVVTFKYPGLGLYSARAHVFGLSSTPNVFSSRDGTSGIDVRSACVNPVCDAFWEWENSTYHVRGVVNGTYELVRERNGK